MGFSGIMHFTLNVYILLLLQIGLFVNILSLCKFGACLNLYASDIDHLTRILFLCGKPEQETIDKIISEEVRILIHSYIT